MGAWAFGKKSDMSVPKLLVSVAASSLSEPLF